MLKSNELAQVSRITRDLAKAKDPPQVLDLEAKLLGIESYMKKAGLYRTEEMREVNELKCGRVGGSVNCFLRLTEVPVPEGKKISQPGKSFIEKIKKWGLEKKEQSRPNASELCRRKIW